MSDSLDDTLCCSSNLGAIVLVCEVFNSFSPRRVRINALANLAQAKTIRHSGCQNANKLTSWPTNGRSTQDLVSALFDVNLNEALFALTKSPIEPAKRFGEGVVLLVLCFQLMRVLANVGYLWVSVGGPRQDKGPPVRASKE